jgi:hypothetical protein
MVPLGESLLRAWAPMPQEDLILRRSPILGVMHEKMHAFSMQAHIQIHACKHIKAKVIS